MDKTAQKLGEDEPQQEEKYGSGLARADNIVNEVGKTGIGNRLYSLNRNIIKRVNPMRWNYGR